MASLALNIDDWPQIVLATLEDVVYQCEDEHTSEPMMVSNMSSKPLPSYESYIAIAQFLRLKSVDGSLLTT